MTDDHRSTTLPDVNSSRTRILQVTPHPYFTPDNAIVAAAYRDRTTGELDYYPVEVKRKDLLAALGAEPDESDYAEVVAENNRLGRKLSEALRDRDANRAEPDESDYAEVIEENNRLGRKLSAALRERDTARLRIQEILSDRDSWKARAEEARKDRDAALEALRTAEDAPEDQVQIDRSWALEKAGEVLGRLAAVGVDARACGVSLLPLAEWILGGEEDRG